MSYDIRNIQNINHLIMYFSKVLNWDIDTDSFDDIDDISYDFSASDLGLKEEAFAKIKSIKQLPPLVDGQKWGIFCIEFDSKRFEVTALRKVLSGLVPSRRNSVDHAVWRKEDLLFLCFWGEDNNRTIGIAHFEDKQDGLPQIKMTYCAPAIEDTIQIQDFNLKIGNLKWPVEVNNFQKWHDDWSKAFTTSYKQVIRDSQTLTIQLAKEAIGIRDRILETLKIETEEGYVHQLYNKFKETLIHDMSEKDFADMYAQTVVYGLFSARCMDETQEDFSAAEAVECLPNTNPFLKSLMKECLGDRENSKLSFDELEIGNVVDLLMHTNTVEIIKDFNRQTGGGKEDPVIHFYEEFLTAYDKTQKVQRGVYYTPQPIVNYMVREVDHIIKEEFGLEDGLASTETKKIKYMRPRKRSSNDYNAREEIEDVKDVPAVQILDPATGTGTFLRQIILQIYDNFKTKRQSQDDSQKDYEWNEYVPKHLLTRLNAFELMMAPYAVAHMKLAMVLKDTGYKFKDNGRLNVYLANTLEKPGNSDKQMSMFDDPIASESIAANALKKNTAINVIIGNPPYSVSSSNKGEYIEKMVSEYKKGLKEKNIQPLSDDYIKFICYSENLLRDKNQGILAFITNNSYLDGLIHCKMREHLLRTFDKIFVLNLHGNSRIKEVSPDGSKDENVFDIMQGVSIAIMVRNYHPKNTFGQVFYAELYGKRQSKFDALNAGNIQFKELQIAEPNFFFVPKDFSLSEEYNKGILITDLFNKNTVGLVTGKDDCLAAFSETELLNGIHTIKSSGSGEAFSRIKDETIDSNNIKILSFRPFDNRYTYYKNGVLNRSRYDVLHNMIDLDNLALVTERSMTDQDSYYHGSFVSRYLVDKHLTGGASYAYPLYIDGGYEKISNINANIRKEICNILEENVSDSEIFAYSYCILNAPSYQKKYSQLLKTDFPRIPLPKKSNFKELVSLGDKLCTLHLMKELIPTDINFPIDGNDTIEKISYKDGKVFINRNQFFSYVEEDVWNYFIGAYQPAQKWLKDRKGKVLSREEINHYSEILAVIKETIHIISEIESVTKDDF